MRKAQSASSVPLRLQVEQPLPAHAPMPIETLCKPTWDEDTQESRLCPIYPRNVLARSCGG